MKTAAEIKTERMKLVKSKDTMHEFRKGRGQLPLFMLNLAMADALIAILERIENMGSDKKKKEEPTQDEEPTQEAGDQASRNR